MSRIQLAVAVIQCIAVSPTIPVRMEELATLEVLVPATLVRAFQTIQDKHVKVSTYLSHIAHLNSY